MDTRPCKHCENPVARSAKRCPSCGGKDPYPLKPQEIMLGCGVIIAIVVAVMISNQYKKSTDSRNDRIQHSSSVPQQKSVTNDAPSWYQGSKPWGEISEEGQRELLEFRSKFEADQSRASEPSISGYDPAIVRAGEDLIASICDDYGVDEFYKKPAVFGSRMVVWLPETAWNKLSDSEKESIAVYLSSRFTNWGIGVGRVSGKDVLADRLIRKH